MFDDFDVVPPKRRGYALPEVPDVKNVKELAEIIVAGTTVMMALTAQMPKALQKVTIEETINTVELYIDTYIKRQAAGQQAKAL